MQPPVSPRVSLLRTLLGTIYIQPLFGVVFFVDGGYERSLTA